MNRFVSAALLGISVGLRSQTAPAALSIAERRGARSLLAVTFALGEFVADVRPSAPDRTTPLPLIARVVIGARAGRAVGEPGSLLQYALIGATAAFVGAHVGLAARRAASERLGPLPAAIIEDAVAIALAVAGASSVRR
jgi:uncharacterized membrane protein